MAGGLCFILIYSWSLDLDFNLENLGLGLGLDLEFELRLVNNISISAPVKSVLGSLARSTSAHTRLRP